MCKTRRGAAATWPVLLFLCCAAVGCDDDGNLPDPLAAGRRVSVGVDTSAVVAAISKRFLSVAVDTAQVVGGTFWNPDGSGGTVGNFRVPPFDFSRPRLRALAKHLAPAYLRIGGTDADLTYYDLSGSDPPAQPPAGYDWVLTRKQWDGFVDFAKQLDYRILFTLNAGAGPRDATGAWTPDNARALVEHAVKTQAPVDVWELGNEVNGYSLLLGITVTPATYAADLRRARAMISAAGSKARFAGPATAYWPGAGDFNGYYLDLMKQPELPLDIVTWHYYPQQSRRCPLNVRRAGPDVMLDPNNLDEALVWAQQVERGVRRSIAGGAEIWLGETGNAQCGGERGVSDRFAGTLWWLDQLGALARRGHKVVVRQTLAGSDYGLLDDQTLAPKPDYWASVLWRRLVGQRVLQASSGDPMLRAYAHCARGDVGRDLTLNTGAVVVLLINIDQNASLRVDLGALGRGALGDKIEVYALTASTLKSDDVWLNDRVLTLGKDDALPSLEPRAVTGTSLVLEPASIAFVVAPDAGARACQR